MKKILMTGHLGLVGRHLKPLLEKQGYLVQGFDLADGSGDICQSEQLNKVITDALDWLEDNPEADKDDYDEKQKNLGRSPMYQHKNLVRLVTSIGMFQLMYFITRKNNGNNIKS